MPDPEPVLLAWSGGKDSALSLEALRGDPRYRVVALLTTEARPSGYVSMTRIPGDLVEAQARAVGLPLTRVSVPERPSNDEYEAAMRTALAPFVDQGVRTCAFGDLFLEDVRAYREKQLARAGMSAIFPLWGEPTDQVVRRFIALGYRAVVAAVDPQRLPPGYCGRELDAAFIDDLPAWVDPAGENGEFHTFVYDGPSFSAPVHVRAGAAAPHQGLWCSPLEPAC